MGSGGTGAFQLYRAERERIFFLKIHAIPKNMVRIMTPKGTPRPMEIRSCAEEVEAAACCAVGAATLDDTDVAGGTSVSSSTVYLLCGRVSVLDGRKKVWTCVNASTKTVEL